MRIFNQESQGCIINQNTSLYLCIKVVDLDNCKKILCVLVILSAKSALLATATTVHIDGMDLFHDGSINLNDFNSSSNQCIP